MTASIDTIKAAISSQGGLAKGNKFLVELPNIGGSMRAMNTLCNSANMPGKQITTVDRRIGMEFEKIAYGYAVDDVTMTFYMPNSYLPKKYFDTWRSIIINENSQVAAYKSSYARPIRIHQLRQTLPSNAKNIKVGLLNLKIPGVNDILNTFASKKDINITTSAYTVELIDAFPTTLGQVELNNQPDALVQMNVQISYTNWRRVKSSQISFKL